MKVFMWNCQGVGNKLTKCHLRHLIQVEKPNIVFLSETKNNLANVSKLLGYCKLEKWHIIPAIDKVGGLAIAWGNHINLEVVHFDNNFINCLIKDENNEISWVLTCMYGSMRSFRYLIVSPEKCGFRDLFQFLFWFDQSVDPITRFIDTQTTTSSDEDDDDDDDDGLGPISGDHRWVIIVSIIARKVIGVLGKPMEWCGYLVEFILNLLSHNGGDPISLLYNLLRGKVVMPHRNSDTFISAIRHLDGRIDLYKNTDLSISSALSQGIGAGNRVLMDLCVMASKLAYEKQKSRQKYHRPSLEDFQKERSTQVFILSDKPKDADIILISFRGTEPFDADDWSSDFDYSWYEIPKLGKVHMGFLEALGLGNRTQASTFQSHLQVGGLKRDHSLSHSNDEETSTDEVELTAYYAVRSKLKEMLDEHKNAKFIVTGHSLGGALAILFPTILLLHEENETMLGVYTFGQPRVGNRHLGRFMESHIVYPNPRYFRVVYCNDLVPRLPYDDKAFLYKHFGPCLYYDSNYIGQRMDEEPNRNYFGLRYLIPEYMNAVWELIRSLTMDSTYGTEYKEGWFSIFLRVVGSVLPGLSAHSPINYVNSVRLGREHVDVVHDHHM